MDHPKNISQVILRGEKLSLEEVIAVARYHAHVSMDPQAAQKVQLCRKVVEVFVEKQWVAYGITTGFGALRDVMIPQEKTRELQSNLIRSHACGVGRPFPEEVVRGAVLLRANTLLKGHSGVRLEIIEALVQLLEKNLYPYIPEKGSLGASGDLCPLSHLALVLMGDREGRFLPSERKSEFSKVSRQEDFFLSTKKNLLQYGFTPVELEAKEGLALNNGTQFISSLSCFALWDGKTLVENAKRAFAMSLEASKGVLDALDPRLYEVRSHAFQKEVAGELREFLGDSQILHHPLNSAYLQRALKNLERIYQWTKKSSKIKSIEKQIQGLLKEAGKASLSKENSYDEKRKPYEKTLISIEKEIENCFTQEIPSAVSSQKIHSSLLSVLQDVYASLPLYAPVQDDYSFRCGLQVLSSALHALAHLESVVATELNSATDNPLIFPPQAQEFLGKEEEYKDFLLQNPHLLSKTILSGGNFHGIPLAIPLDYLSCALAEIASISERRTAHLVDSSLNNGLPAFLAEDPGLQSACMIPQYTAASLVSENKILAHPASVDSIPTSANREDYVSMATIAARKCLQILEHGESVVAIEILCAAQGLEFRKPFLPSSGCQKILKKLKALRCLPLKGDPPLYRQIQEISRWIREERFL